jgi:ketosteroid isomerase-like protein
MKLLLLALLVSTPSFAANKGAAPKAAAKEEAAVAETLDLWHMAASQHAEDAYFSLMTKDAVFLGTDPHERWTKPEFQKWAHPIFSKGKGWTLKSVKRNVFFSPDKKTAWFDEDVNSEELGPARGSGVVVKDAHGKWKVAQYNLSVPIPNDKFEDARKLFSSKAAK